MSNLKVGDVYERSADVAPFPKARPRVTRNGTFMPAKYQRQRNELAAYFVDWPDFSDCLIRLEITNVRAMPQSWSNQKRDAMTGQWCSAGADVDNAAGAVMDALFEDDKCIVSLMSDKVWGVDNKISVRITVLSTDPIPF